MTIPSNLNVRQLNDRLSNLEFCAEKAPINTYELAKDAAEAIDEASNAVMEALRVRGFVALNNDHLRVVEAVIYGYLLAGNLNKSGLLTGEGFGAAMNGPAADRVLAQTIRDRDFFAAQFS